MSQYLHLPDLWVLVVDMRLLGQRLRAPSLGVQAQEPPVPVSSPGPQPLGVGAAQVEAGPGWAGVAAERARCSGSPLQRNGLQASRGGPWLPYRAVCRPASASETPSLSSKAVCCIDLLEKTVRKRAAPASTGEATRGGGGTAFRRGVAV